MKYYDPIITDFDDQDMYKFTMLYMVFKLFPNSAVKWKFFNRGKHKFPVGFREALKEQVDYFKDLKFTDEIEHFFRRKFVSYDGNSFFDETFYTFLKGFKFDTDNIKITQIGDELDVEYSGFWHQNILWEVQLMAVICELYYKMTGLELEAHDVETRNRYDIEKFQNLALTNSTIADFSTRRRFSKENQERMLKLFIEEQPKTLVGTSNVALARKYDLNPIGTMAHEAFMFHAAKYGVLSANRIMQENWSNVFKGNLGTVLTDTFTTKNFLENFDIYNSKLYDGVRHDSGDPFKFTEKIVNHYKSKGIDPSSKLIVFSDGINKTSLVRDLKQHCDKLGIKCSFGIGTWFSNDVGVQPMNIVIKMTDAKPFGKDWRYCVKISDSKGKYTYTDKETLNEYLKKLNKEQIN